MTTKAGEGFFAGKPESAGFSSDKPHDSSDEKEILRKIREVAGSSEEFDVLVRKFMASNE
jgi:hypothetical protein